MTDDPSVNERKWVVREVRIQSAVSSCGYTFRSGREKMNVETYKKDKKITAVSLRGLTSDVYIKQRSDST